VDLRRRRESGGRIGSPGNVGIRRSRERADPLSAFLKVAGRKPRGLDQMERRNERPSGRSGRRAGSPIKPFRYGAVGAVRQI